MQSQRTAVGQRKKLYFQATLPMTQPTWECERACLPSRGKMLISATAREQGSKGPALYKTPVPFPNGTVIKVRPPDHVRVDMGNTCDTSLQLKFISLIPVISRQGDFAQQTVQTFCLF